MMKKVRMLFLAAVGALGLTASAAPAVQAQELLFNYVGASGTFSFAESSSPTPVYYVDGNSFGINPTGFVDGAASSFDGGVVFYTSSNSGGLETYNGFNLEGAQLFIGSTSSPTFLTGTFTLDDYPSGTPNGVLTIAPEVSVSAAPEPSTWALMIAGVGVMGAALRFARRRDGVYAAA